MSSDGQYMYRIGAVTDVLYVRASMLIYFILHTCRLLWVLFGLTAVHVMSLNTCNFL